MVQIEQTESRHVMRMQMQIAPTVRAAAGIGRPEDIGNTDRLEDLKHTPSPCLSRQRSLLVALCSKELHYTWRTGARLSHCQFGWLRGIRNSLG
jgi:hypothetical protein